MSISPSIVWFRQDLRLADNRALQAALARGGPIVPVYLHAPDEESPWQAGAASRWWLHHSLLALQDRLAATGSRLILQTGSSRGCLADLVRETGAEALFWNRRYEPAVTLRDTGIKEFFRSQGVRTESFAGALLSEPWTVRNQAGGPFQVFTPFWRHCRACLDPAAPATPPALLSPPRRWPASLRVADLGLEPRIAWAGGMAAAWEPGEDGARRQLESFLAEGLAAYNADRNRPDLRGTSRLSPHLHFGETSPAQIWHAVRLRAEKVGGEGADWRDSRFITEVGWREFAHHLLFHFPHTPSEPLRENFQHFPWREDAIGFKAWTKGLTGYPIVDAGMRELWATGWMHNRVRMIVASFLVKDLLIPWQKGAAWFWDTLVDADLAQNTFGWQWTAGCGADAAPYFRIFNPVSQGEKFDPRGDYVRRWCPELARLPDEVIHQPWEADLTRLAGAGVVLGRCYPHRLVDHDFARKRALQALAETKRA